jgi:hypothetical protein
LCFSQRFAVFYTAAPVKKEEMLCTLAFETVFYTAAPVKKEEMLKQINALWLLKRYFTPRL